MLYIVVGPYAVLYTFAMYMYMYIVVGPWMIIIIGEVSFISNDSDATVDQDIFACKIILRLLILIFVAYTNIYVMSLY